VRWAPFCPIGSSSHGFGNTVSIFRFFQQLFANRIGAFFGLDVIVSSFVLWIFVLFEGRRIGLLHLWLPIAASLVVGVSLGLPLFLYVRQLRLDATQAA
jgi:Protein of unknown function DUF2834